MTWVGRICAAAVLLVVPALGWSGAGELKSQTSGLALRNQFTMAVAQGGAFDLSSDGRLLAAVEEDGSVSVVDAVTGNPVRTIGALDSSAPSRLRFAPDGRLLAGTMPDEVVIWDVSSGSTLRVPVAGAESLAFSPDDSMLAVGAGNSTMNIALFNARSGALLREWKAGPPAYGGVYSLAFAPNGRELVSGQGHEAAEEWDSATGALLRVLPGKLPYWNSAQPPAFSHDGRYLALKAGRDCEVVDLMSGSVLRKVAKGLNGEPLAFSADGLDVMVLVDSASSEAGPRQHEVTIWNFQAAKRVGTIPLGAYQGFAVAPVLMNPQTGTLVRAKGINELAAATLPDW
jgi:WD40 repeat protein